MINTASKSYNKLLNIHTTHYNKLSEDSKKRVSVLKYPEMLELDFGKYDFPSLEGDEEVKLDSGETIGEKVKSILKKEKVKEQD